MYPFNNGTAHEYHKNAALKKKAQANWRGSTFLLHLASLVRFEQARR
jgi:hypothetical protein